MTNTPNGKSFSEKLLDDMDEFIEQEVEVRVKTLKNDLEEKLPEDIEFIRLNTADGFTSGTIHQVVPGIWATAFHVTDDTDFSPLLQTYGDCYTVERQRNINVDKPDVHFFTFDETLLSDFKKACPSPEEAALNFLIDAQTYNLDDNADPAGSIFGYPHGITHGLPQRRVLIPFTPSNLNDLGDLLWFRCMNGPAVGGMSGGKVCALSDEAKQSQGVIVATAFFNPEKHVAGTLSRDYVALQLFHNDMKLIKAAAF